MNNEDAMDVWGHLAADETGVALQLAKRAYEDSKFFIGKMISLAAIQLWLREWNAAYETCQRFIDSPRWSADSAYSMAGTAKWCAGDREAAVVKWKQGIDVEYADTAGGISIPLHLLFAAASQSDLVPKDEVVVLLRARLNGSRGHRWPGHLGRLVLGEMSHEEVLTEGIRSISHLRDEQFRQSQKFIGHKIDFWEGVRLLSTGDTDGFLAAMQKCAELSLESFDTDRDLLIDLLRSSEFHLARHQDRSALDA